MDQFDVSNSAARARLMNAPDDYEIECSSCGDISELQDCPKTGSGIGFCCPNCFGEMRHKMLVGITNTHLQDRDDYDVTT
mgnify:CR=1 FL=1